ncbi:TonB-dependent receptor [Salegentibacter salegens]|uniref:Iron complex outermembrane recepter protein n=1 Tax=Salegentibacter salegens TaxID=143223 RepID=A0A1M7MLH8_9FLAO|nr:TonB-dependent receptor [Salegentibacter salegens]PRX43227.1 iron complex outermembrane receptor protein [Salegentibacter salegens]SHM91786.1 iron complex outermembrane recepter protein [Salegentibacter salegens]
MKTLAMVISIFYTFLGFAQTGKLSGKITSEENPVAFANIYVENLNLGTTAKGNGVFLLKNIPSGNHIIQVSAIGYKKFTQEVFIAEAQSTTQNFELEKSSSELDEVLIVDTQTGLTRRTPYNVSSISMQGIENKGNPNGMMGSLRQVPGVYGAEFGQGIVKPFIRGLGFSRVVTIYQGNKLENHQWGADHGLGINDLGIKKVEVIKGPASVLYGSGALGGVLLTQDDEFYKKSTKISGNIGTTFNSVSNGIRTYASAGKSFENGIFIATDLAFENHADYKNGNGRVIGNSRFNTNTLRLHTGIEKENFQNKLSFSFNDQNLGIILDEEMQDSQSLATTRNDREMQLPFQEVKDYLLSYNQTTKHEKFETSLHLSHHSNNRKEVEENFDLVDLGLQQNHSFYNARISFPNGKIKHSLGTQGSFVKTQNIKNSQEFLIPDADVIENGFYYLASLDIESWYLQGALRYDYRNVTADASSEELIADEFILPGNPENRKLMRTFNGFTGSIGATKKFNTRNQLKLNFSTGFRAPDLAELFSNGPHPGTSRFEKGNDQFGREQSLQVDASYTYRNKRFEGTFSAFGSRVNNYIYFTATDETLPDGNLEVWSYLQTDADLYGFEFELKHSWLNQQRLETKLSGAIVRAWDIKNERNLSFIPPDNFNLQVGYFGLNDRSLYTFSKLRLISNQNRAGLNEETTAGYKLLNLGLSKKFNLGNNQLESGITVYNALNKNYVDHMSILRAFNVNSPGRNFMLNLKYNF